MQDSNQKKIYELLPDLTDQHSISCQMDESHGYVLKHEDCIWQDIELPDVLRAIEKAVVEVELSIYGNTLLIGHYEKAGRNGYYSHDYWDLTKPYEGQSDEFKAFLKSILGV